MILVINVCKEKLHYYEFVLPILKILDKLDVSYSVLNYKNIKKSNLEGIKKVIITGTSIKDNDFIKNINYFNWILNYDKPILGICAGFEILQLVYGGKIKKLKEIGIINLRFNKEFLGQVGENKVYSLHQNYSISKDFVIYAKNEKGVYALKHRTKPFYGVLFHPEVYNKEIISKFLEIKI